MGWAFLAPFAAATLIAVWFSVERLVVLKRNRVIPKPFVERFLEHLHQPCAVRRFLADRLVEENDAADEFFNSFGREKHLSVRPSVFFRGFDVD